MQVVDKRGVELWMWMMCMGNKRGKHHKKPGVAASRIFRRGWCRASRGTRSLASQVQACAEQPLDETEETANRDLPDWGVLVSLLLDGRTM